MTRGPSSVILIAPNWLGDAVMSLPLVGYLASVPGLRLRVVAPPYTARVYMGLDEVDELIVISRTGFGRGLFKRARTLSKLNVDAGIVLPPSFSAALTLFLSGVQHRIGYASDARSALLTRPLRSNALRDEHLSQNYLRLGGEALVRLRLTEPAARTLPSTRVFDQDRDTLAKKLADRGLGQSAYAVVAPGAIYGPTKHWPIDRYLALIDRLRGDVPVVVAGGPNEKELSRTIAAGRDHVTDMTGETTLGEFFALLGGARVVVANDSGAPHVAASLGVPVVVIFGSTSPVWTSPLGRDVRVVREPVHCSPCFRRDCPTHLECFDGITTERVYNQTIEAIRGHGFRTAG